MCRIHPYPAITTLIGQVNTHRVTLREILCYMIGWNLGSYPEHELLRRYRRALGDDEVVLPARIGPA